MIGTFRATALKYTKDNKSWSAEGAMQGRYGDQALRTGAMLFGTVRSVDWTNQNITKIELTLVFDKVGSDGAKTVKLYAGAKDTISGSGASMRGAYIGGFVTNGKAYVNTTVNAFSPGSEVFGGLVDWLKTGSTKTLAMYKWEETDGGWSPNYLRVTAATMTVTYEPAGSGGTLDRDAVDAGELITLAVEPLESAAGVLTHNVKWSMGGYSAQQNLAAGVSEAGFTVPLEWLNAIPDAASGTATCALTTYEDGTERGTRTLEFTVAAPASAAPAFTASAKPVSGKNSAIGGYYQHIGQALLSMTDVQVKYGAKVAAYSITGGEGENASASDLTTGYFQNAGRHAYLLTVTDTRGLSTSKEVAFDVIAVALPKITAFDVQRYSAVTDGETTRYAATDYGDRVWVSVSASGDAAGGNNAFTAYILYGPVGSEERTRVNLAPSGGSLELADSRAVITAEISTDTAYVFELYFGDLAGSAGAADSVAKGRCNVHYAGSGYGVGFGGFAQGTEENPMLQSWYPGYFYEGIHGVNIYSAEEIDTGGVWIDGKKIYRRVFADGNVPKSTDNQGTSLGTIAGLDTVVDMRGIFTESASVSQKPIPYYYATDMRIVTGTRATDGENAVFIVTTVAGSAFVIVDYTKT